MTYQELRDTYGPNAFKLWAHYPFERHFLNPLEAPKEIQFKTGLPHIKPRKVVRVGNGDVIDSVYYADKIGSQLVHPLAMVEFQWIRTEPVNGETRLLERIAKACWSVVGNSDDEEVWVKEGEQYVKRWSKDYDERTGRLADKRKRASIIDEMLAQVGPFGVLPYVQTMLNSLDDERNGYIDTYDKRFVEKVQSYSGSWLDTDVSQVLDLQPGTTLRYAILGSLDYDRKVID